MMELRADMRRLLDEGTIQNYISAEELRPYSKEDAGVDQEGFRLLEEMELQMEQEIDWKLIKRIEMETGESL